MNRASVRRTSKGPFPSIRNARRVARVLPLDLACHAPNEQVSPCSGIRGVWMCVPQQDRPVCGLAGIKKLVWSPAAAKPHFLFRPLGRNLVLFFASSLPFTLFEEMVGATFGKTTHSWPQHGGMSSCWLPNALGQFLCSGSFISTRSKKISARERFWVLRKPHGRCLLPSPACITRPPGRNEKSRANKPLDDPTVVRYRIS